MSKESRMMLCPDGGFGDRQGYTRSLSLALEVSDDDPESLILCWRLQTVGRSSSIHRWRTAASLVQWLSILPLVGTRSTTKSSRVLGLASTHSGVNKHRTKEAVTGDGRKGRYRTQGKHEFARAGRHTTSEQRTREDNPSYQEYRVGCFQATPFSEVTVITYP